MKKKTEENIINWGVKILLTLIKVTVLYLLWNYLMPKYFGISKISWLDAFYIKVFSLILFKTWEVRIKD